MFLDLFKHDRDKPAAVDSKGNAISYGRLLDFASSFNNDRSLERGMAFVLCRNDVRTLGIYVACMINGIVPLMLSADTDVRLLERLADIYHPAYLFGSPGDVGRWTARAAVTISGMEGDCAVAYFNGKPFPLYESLALLLTTSGSTGSPKLVRHSYSNLEKQAENVAAFFGITEKDRPLINLPLMYTMGLSVVNSHLLRGCTLLLTDESMLSKKFADFLKAERVTSLTGVPYTFELLKRTGLERLELSELNLLTQGGGKLRPELQKEFAAYIIGRGGRYIATYGQTEGSARMAFLPSEYALTKTGSIGNAIPGGKLYIVDGNKNTVTSPYTEGEMYYEGPNVTLGYARSGEDLALGDERNGILPTGDIAYFDEDGMFYVTGRMNRFLKLFGHRVSLDECESLIRDGMHIESACVGNDSRLVVYVAEKDCREDIIRMLSDRTGLYAHGIEVRTVEKIPRTGAGKIMYSALET